MNMDFIRKLPDYEEVQAQYPWCWQNGERAYDRELY